MEHLKNKFVAVAAKIMVEFSYPAFCRSFSRLNQAIMQTLQEQETEFNQKLADTEKKLAVARHALENMKKQNIHTQEGKLYIEEMVKSTLTLTN